MTNNLIINIMGYFKKHLSALLKFIKSKKEKIILVLILLLLGYLIYIVFLMIRVSPAELALAELKKSFEMEKICHETCYLWRQSKESIIVSGLKNKESRIEKEISNYWHTENSDLDFKKEIVRLNFLAYGKENIPEYLKKYINESNFKSDLASLIISLFDLDLSDLESLDIDLNNKFTLATSSVEKIEILKAMVSLGNDLEVDTYFSLLSSGEEVEVKKELIRNISSIRDKTNYFTLNQLEIIKNIVNATETDIRLRQALVLLIGDYYLIYPKESTALWFEIYNSETLDSISRLFSADNLNHLQKLNLSLPEVSPIDWETYYNQ